MQGNYIGTDVTGKVALANPASGIVVYSINNLIGGMATGAGNVISGNMAGVQIGGGTSAILTGIAAFLVFIGVAMLSSFLAAPAAKLLTLPAERTRSVTGILALNARNLLLLVLTLWSVFLLPRLAQREVATENMASKSELLTS